MEVVVCLMKDLNPSQLLQIMFYQQKQKVLCLPALRVKSEFGLSDTVKLSSVEENSIFKPFSVLSSRLLLKPLPDFFHVGLYSCLWRSSFYLWHIL